nr:MAG TPA: hypothetical protein [Bacteriophage sp.]
MCSHVLLTIIMLSHDYVIVNNKFSKITIKL